MTRTGPRSKTVLTIGYSKTLPATDTPPVTEGAAPPAESTGAEIAAGISTANTPNGSPTLGGSPSLNRTNTTGLNGASRHRTNTRSTSRSTTGDRIGRDQQSPSIGSHAGSTTSDRTLTMPAEATKSNNTTQKSGMLGLFSRKGGRARSPKPREPGVLGKEGARVIINNDKKGSFKDWSH